MNKSDLERLVDLRILEAETLFTNSCFAGAYYLSGYVVECALKACIAKNTKQYDFPDKKLVLDSYSHDLSKLIHVAGLKNELGNEVMRNSTFETHWDLVQEWSEESRYDPNISMEMANNIFSAITDDSNGVLIWLKKYY